MTPQTSNSRVRWSGGSSIWPRPGAPPPAVQWASSPGRRRHCLAIARTKPARAARSRPCSSASASAAVDRLEAICLVTQVDITGLLKRSYDEQEPGQACSFRREELSDQECRFGRVGLRSGRRRPAPSHGQVSSIEPSAVRSLVVIVSFQVVLMSIHQRAYRHQSFLRGGFHSSGGLSSLERLEEALTANELRVGEVVGEAHAALLGPRARS